MVLYRKPGISLWILLKESTRRIETGYLLEYSFSNSHLEILAKTQVVRLVVFDQLAEIKITLVLIGTTAFT
jgi:hypothetical protein